MTHIVTHIVLPLTLLTTTFALAQPAQAAGTLTRTYVSSAGSNSNPCTLTAPCASFATAYAAVVPNGIVAALDPGRYGPLTITGPVTINGYGWAAITGPAAGNGITINAGSNDNVALIGLEIDGAGAANNGILFNFGGGLEITDCAIRNFTQNGIYIGPVSHMNLLISNTRVLYNAAAGIDLEPQTQQMPASSGVIIASIDRVTANFNGYGILLNSATAGSFITGTIINSVVNSNVNAGITATGSTSGTVFVAIKESNASNNSGSAGGISVSNSNTYVLLSHSLIGNDGIMISNGGVVESAGDNDIFNGSVFGGGTLQSNPKQ